MDEAGPGDTYQASAPLNLRDRGGDRQYRSEQSRFPIWR